MREITLQEVVITATRKQAVVQDTPFIDARELELSSIKTVDDVPLRCWREHWIHWDIAP